MAIITGFDAATIPPLPCQGGADLIPWT